MQALMKKSAAAERVRPVLSLKFIVSSFWVLCNLKLHRYGAKKKDFGIVCVYEGKLCTVLISLFYANIYNGIGLNESCKNQMSLTVSSVCFAFFIYFMPWASIPSLIMNP